MSDGRSSAAAPAVSTAPPAYVDVIVPRRLYRPFTYVIPPELEGKMEVGQSVIVPFGTQSLHGLVVAVYSLLPAGAPAHGLKAICSLADASPDQHLTSNQIELSRWVADRYAAPWGQCIKLVLPPIEQGGRVQPRYLLTEQGLDSLSIAPEERDEVEMQLLKRISRRPKGITASTLAPVDKTRVMAALQALVWKGLIVRQDTVENPRAVRPGKKVIGGKNATLAPTFAFDMTAGPPLEAATWPATVDQALSRGTFASLLIHAGGNTRLWCLVTAVQATLRHGRRVLIITGDVERVNRLTEVLAAAGEQPLLLHSGLSVRDRAMVWSSVRNASTTIVVGTRMAAFVPIERLGLVWVEGEDDASLKEEQVPRYHGREVARRRAVCDDALLVLASSHPSLESWSAVQQGDMMACVYRDQATSPNVQIIDLKGYARESRTGTSLTPPLCDSLRGALRQQALAIVYLNRKGFATVLHCRDCGAMPRCDACSVTLTFYKRSNHMRCHYCGQTKPVPEHCSHCQSLKLEPVGSGTERLEETVRRMFPQARVGRVDSETIRRPSDARAFLRLLAAGDLDIVIGTQMLFHLGLQGQAAFVAVPDADAGLHVPDFRSAERMYHHLVDAVELARPAHAGGVVMVQTRFTDHHAMVALARGDDSLFLEPELMFRRMLHYPPYTCLVRLDVSGTLEPTVAQAAHRWAGLLREEVAGVEIQELKDGRQPVLTQGVVTMAGEKERTVILGPSPAPHARARGRHHWQILLKGISHRAETEMAIRTVEVLERGPRPGALRFDIDVDPITMG